MKISICGNIASGKSTLLANLANAAPENYTTVPEPLDEWRLLEKFSTDPAKYAFAFSMEVLLSFAKLKSVPGALVVERSPVDTIHVFSDVLMKNGSLGKEEMQILQKYCDEYCWTPDVVIYVDTPAHVCYDRIEHRGRKGEDALSYEYIKCIDYSYKKALTTAYKNATVYTVSQEDGETHEDFASRVQTIILDHCREKK